MYYNKPSPGGSYKTFWNGIEIIKSNAQATGTFTVLDSKKATSYWTREGVSVEFGYDQDDFSTNSMTVRAKLRGAVTNYRPNGIVSGTFANAIASLNNN